GHELAEAETGDGGRDRLVRPAELFRGAWFRVPRVELGQAAVLVDENTRLVAPVGSAEQPGQAEPADGTSNQKLPARRTDGSGHGELMVPRGLGGHNRKRVGDQSLANGHA